MMKYKILQIKRVVGILLLAVIFYPTTASAQMETSAGDMVLTAGASVSDISLGFNGTFQLNVTNKIAVHPAFNYNTFGGGQTFLSVDAWAGYHGLSNIPYLNMSAEGKSNVDAFLNFGPSFYIDEDDTGFAFGAGGGARYYLNSRMGITVQGKYRMIIGDSYSYLKWYELGVGFSYAI